VATWSRADDEPVDSTPIELRGLPEFEGAISLLDALLFHSLPGLSLVDIRRVAQCSKAVARAMDDDEVWRLAAAACATRYGLYAPSACVNWKRFFMETLWPARSKWRGAGSTESVGFRIRVAVRVRPRKHDASRHDGLVLPLHQRLKMLKRGQKLGSLDEERGGSTQEQLCEALKDQGDLSPELLEALMEAQQLGAVMHQAAAQAAGGPKGGADIAVEEAAHAAAAAAEASTEATTLTADDHKSLAQAEAAVGKEKAKEKEKAVDDKENGDEQGKGGTKLLLVQPSRVVMFVPGCGLRPFHFPTVCDDKVSQLEVYQRVAQDAVTSSLNGMNACVLAYGQTGSGKTHTVFGPPGTIEAACHTAERTEARAPSAEGLGCATTLPPNAGLVLRTCEELLACVQRPGVACRALSLSAQYIQIYDESLTDLLSGGPVQLRELGEYADAAPGAPTNGGAVLQGAVHVKLETLSDALALLRAGELHKRVAATAMNDTSSRAHTVFLITLTQRGGEGGEIAGAGVGGEGEGERVIGSQLALVDLAGCEQLKQSKVVGQRMREAVGINSSLLVLGKCITALSEGRRHVPYNEAKLTKLLRGAFGGSSRTTCVIAASPDDAHGENTVQALRFGERCATITNSARIGAVSASQALKLVDEALSACEQSMASLEAKDRTNLPAYATLKARHSSLVMRRQTLAAS